MIHSDKFYLRTRTGHYGNITMWCKICFDTGRTIEAVVTRFNLDQEVPIDKLVSLGEVHWNTVHVEAQ